MPGYESLRELIETIATAGVPAEAVEHRGYRNRLFTLPTPAGQVNIKAFRLPTFPNKFIYTNFRKSKARRSAEHALKLLSLGIGTPPPVAWIEIKRGGQLRESYYISLEVPVEGDLRYWERLPAVERDTLLEAYARFMVRLHEHGVLHHDLSPGNVIWTRDEHGDYNFKLVDLNRMSFFDRPLHVKQRLSHFRNINIGFVFQSFHLIPSLDVAA
ncbi:MAG: hypothetical protein K2K84_08565, partial [Muribaculaceae bacterium]|nr:hypothetical protein [Muribaculaceae bacterium]